MPPHEWNNSIEIQIGKYFGEYVDSMNDGKSYNISIVKFYELINKNNITDELIKRELNKRIIKRNISFNDKEFIMSFVTNYLNMLVESIRNETADLQNEFHEYLCELIITFTGRFNSSEESAFVKTFIDVIHNYYKYSPSNNLLIENVIRMMGSRYPCNMDMKTIEYIKFNYC
jgi:hypothetical protein